MSKRTVLLEALQTAPTDVARMLAKVNDEMARRRPTADEWSIADVVNHLFYVEKKYRARLKRVKEEERPELPYIHPDESAHDLAAPLRELIERFQVERAETMAFLNTLSLGDWQRPAVHETWGEVRFRYLVQHLVEHDTAHLNQMVEIRQKIVER
jgi:uncharacterized damage-inducible protein DinB